MRILMVGMVRGMRLSPLCRSHALATGIVICEINCRMHEWAYAFFPGIMGVISGLQPGLPAVSCFTPDRALMLGASDRIAAAAGSAFKRLCVGLCMEAVIY